MTGTPDKIIVSGIDCVAAIGVSPEERTMKQRLSVDVEVTHDLRPAGASDSIDDALDYAGIVSVVLGLVDGREYHLIETLAERIAHGVLTGCGGESVRVLVRKMTSPLSARVRFVAVEIVRTSAEVAGPRAGNIGPRT